MADLRYDFSTLPSHILTHILLYTHKKDFKNSVLTCRSWYYASCHPKIACTRNSVMSTGRDSIAVEDLVRPITNLCLEHPNMNRLKYRQLFSKFGQTIVNLIISCNKLTMPKLYEIIVRLPRLKALEIFDGSQKISDSNFQKSRILRKHHDTIVKNLENLEFLAIRTSLTNLEGYKSFMVLCRNLKRLEWNEYGLDTIGQRDFLFDFLLNPKKVPFLDNLDELLIQSICPVNSSDFFAKMVALKLPRLKKLNIMEISNIYHDANFTEFCKYYQHIENLSIGNITTGTFNDIGEFMRNLKKLNLTECHEMRLSPLRNLKLESVAIDRWGEDNSEDEIFFQTMVWPNLKELELNRVSELTLKLICENYKNIETLKLTHLGTHDCEPIFRNLTKLKNLYLEFEWQSKIHSNHIISSDEWNITRLVRLKKLYVTCYVPGITPNLLRTLPNLVYSGLVYDPPDDERTEDATMLDEIFIEDVEPIQEPTHHFDDFVDLDWLFENSSNH